MESQNHRLGVGRDIWRSLSPTYCSKQVSYCRLSRKASRKVLNISSMKWHRKLVTIGITQDIWTLWMSTSLDLLSKNSWALHLQCYFAPGLQYLFSWVNDPVDNFMVVHGPGHLHCLSPSTLTWSLHFPNWSSPGLNNLPYPVFTRLPKHPFTANRLILVRDGCVVSCLLCGLCFVAPHSFSLSYLSMIIVHSDTDTVFHVFKWINWVCPRQ